MYYRRKIDDYLNNWKADPEHKPLIVKGARQIGKTESIMHFAEGNYKLCARKPLPISRLRDESH